MNRSVDQLAGRLYDSGCRHAFGMPGGEVLTLVDALTRAGIEFILCKHENAAGFMAEGTYQRSGAPGILVTTLGPGLANGVNVIANAQQDRVPLIVLSGCVDEDEALSYTHQIMDHEALVGSITKATFRLSAKGAALVADRAVCTAIEDRAGPVLIDVPIGVAEILVEDLKQPRRAVASAVAPADGEALRQAQDWLANAQRPLVMAGVDVLLHSAQARLKEFVEAFGAPLITTYKAKGVLAENHRLAMGGAGLSPLADQHLLELVEQADVIVAVGYDPIEMRSGWRNPWDTDRQRVIEVAAVQNHHYMHQATLSFVCDVGEALNRFLEDSSERPRWKNLEPKRIKDELAKLFTPRAQWGPASIIETSRRLLPRDSIVTVDSGAHRILLSQMWRCYEPRTLLQSTGLCTMGCALPLAIGAKIADPERPVVAFSGDAGLLMCLGDLTTATELGLALMVVVFVDASLALIDLKQRSRKLPSVGVNFERVDFAAVAKALGAQGLHVHTTPELETALGTALCSDGVTLIACELSREAYDQTF